MADKIKFIIPGKPEYLTMVRLALGSIADTAGFDLEEIEDIKTSVQEACKAHWNVHWARKRLKFRSPIPANKTSTRALSP